MIVMAIALACGLAHAADILSDSAVSFSLTGLVVTQDIEAQQIRFIADCREPGDPAQGTYTGEAINRSLEFFFLGLSIPDEKIWVNLTPVEHAQSIDPAIADTDLGKILLAADLTLKKDTSSFTNPRTSQAGRKYWDLLYAKAAQLGIDEMPIANRVWITPGPVKIAEGFGSVRILESSLQVRLEADYMPGQDRTLTAKQRQLQDYAKELMQDLVIPGLSKQVNEGVAYENLRQAYRALVLARWYKEKFGRVQSSFPSRLPYSQAQIQREYMASLRQGEYNFSDNTTDRLSAYMELITRRYFSGGIDWRSTVFVRPSGSAGNRGKSLNDNFSFAISLDSRQPRPVHYALASLRVVPIDTLSQEAGSIAGFDENLPPVSSIDLTINAILKQDPAIHRVMSRNL
jgi:hypothetical protein